MQVVGALCQEENKEGRMVGVKPVRMGLIGACLVSLVVLPNRPIAAQTMTPQTIPSGTRIRVRLNASPGRLLFGSVDTLANDRLSWRPDGVTSTALPLSAINTLEISKGRHSRTAKGALIGGASLGILSLTTFGMMAAAPEGDWMRLEGGWRDALLLSAAGTAAGAGVGAVIGSMFHSEDWQEVPLGGARVGPVSLGRFGVTVSLPF
jgi:hypothetical protein